MSKPKLRKLKVHYILKFKGYSELLPCSLVDTLGIEGALISERDRLIVRYPSPLMDTTINKLNQLIDLI